MSVNWIEYKGKKILFVDYSNRTTQQMIESMREAAEIVKAAPAKVAIMSNFENATVNTDFMSVAKDLGKEVFDPKSRIAAIGIHGVKKVLFNAYNTFTGGNAKAFNSEEEAKDWLLTVV